MGGGEFWEGKHSTHKLSIKNSESSQGEGGDPSRETLSEAVEDCLDILLSLILLYMANTKPVLWPDY